MAICKARIERLSDLNIVFNYWIKDIRCFKYFRCITLHVATVAFAAKRIKEADFRHQIQTPKIELLDEANILQRL